MLFEVRTLHLITYLLAKSNSDAAELIRLRENTTFSIPDLSQDELKKILTSLKNNKIIDFEYLADEQIYTISLSKPKMFQALLSPELTTKIYLQLQKALDVETEKNTLDKELNITRAELNKLSIQVESVLNFNPVKQKEELDKTVSKLDLYIKEYQEDKIHMGLVDIATGLRGHARSIRRLVSKSFDIHKYIIEPVTSEINVMQKEAKKSIKVTSYWAIAGILVSVALSSSVGSYFSHKLVSARPAVKTESMTKAVDFAVDMEDIRCYVAHERIKLSR